MRFGTAVIEGTYRNNSQFVVRIVVSVICVNHVFIMVEPGDHNWHVKICECGYMMNEPHSFTQFGNLMVCSVCGFVIQLNWFAMKE
ncbi:MAG: hypothetical protein FWE36_07175 [Erysipelotrichales bacterium]|nr:hypothetical protein [Erysipelotrichales bacterium]